MELKKKVACDLFKMIILNSITRVIKNDIKGAVRLMSGVQAQSDTKTIVVQGNTYQTDEWTNVTPRILTLMERRLHLQPNHPIGLIKQRIIDFMYGKYNNVRGNPLFSVHQVIGTRNVKHKTNIIKIVFIFRISVQLSQLIRTLIHYLFLRIMLVERNKIPIS